MRFKHVIRSVFVFVAIGLMVNASANCATIDFNTLDHGEIVNSQFASTIGVTFSAVNIGGGPDLAIAFDSTRNSTRDPDLEAPFTSGNLAGPTDLGNLLIIAENGRDTNNDGRIDNPDDEGTRPAGSIFLDFATPIISFGFDLVDVEGPSEYGNDSGYAAKFFMGRTELARVGFGSFVDSNSAFFDQTVSFGDNSANRIDEITAATLGLEAFDRVEINFGGSAAIDNFTFQAVPLPSAFFLLGTGLVAIAGLKRRKLKE